MLDMYEELTKYIQLLKEDKYGKWSGVKKIRKQMTAPFVVYSAVVQNLRSDVSNFIENHEEYKIIKYDDVIENQNIESGRLEDVDVSICDGKSVVAIIDGANRLERFCEGFLLKLFEDGIIQKWLERLKQIDDEIGL